MIGFRAIIVTDANYDRLKSLGRAGDSFNDAINSLLAKEEVQIENAG